MDPLHIHDSWCDVNRSTPVLEKKIKTQSFQTSKSNYQFMERETG